MPAPSATTITDVLAREQAHLDHARDQLRRMREAADRLDAGTAGDASSSELLGRVLARRVASLRDDPHTTLFFGRIDTQTEHGDETFHIGRRHVTDDRGDPVVVDWRAPVSTAFYRASPTEPMGVRLRRRFGVDRGRLTAYEDDRPTLADRGHLHQPAHDGADLASAETHTARRSAIVAAEIERPRSGPMRDIVSTIQPEQDEIVRSGLGTSICVQGAPGTGKTAIGLHRAAWLLYSFRSQLDRSGVLVVGPNRAFLDHIGAVLPSLGEVRVRHATIDSLLDRGRVRAEDPIEVARLKGDARLATVLHRALWSHVGAPSEALVVPRGARRWRVPASEVRDEVDALTTRGVRYSAARELLPRRLAHRVLLQMERAGHTPDDRVQDAISRSAPVRSYVRGLWPGLDPAAVLFELLSDADALAEAARGILTPEEQRTLLWRNPPRSKGAARWSAADLALLDEVADLLDRTPSLGHVVLDEAQDLSPMQLRAVGRRASTGSLTVL
ncbi:MAG: HelD family protein, partial [Phycicoccus sp.]